MCERTPNRHDAPGIEHEHQAERMAPALQLSAIARSVRAASFAAPCGNLPWYSGPYRMLLLPGQALRPSSAARNGM